MNKCLGIHFLLYYDVLQELQKLNTNFFYNNKK